MTKTQALPDLFADLARVEAQIAAAKATAKVEKKLKACKLSNRTAAKYFDLQQAYMNAARGN